MYFLRPRKEASISNPGNEHPSEFVTADASVHAIIVKVLHGLLSQYGPNELMAALCAIGNEMETLAEEEDITESSGSEKGDI